ncbi:putative FCP1 domain, HAD superfamily protein [Helianthus anomalus]
MAPKVVWRIKNTVSASDNRRTSEQDNQKVAGIKNAVADSGESGNSEEQKDEKDTEIDLGISMDSLKLGSKKKKKKLLVIPLRGIFVHRAHRSWPETIPRNRRPDFRYGNFLVYMRPYCVEFLKFCFERFDVGLWSSAREQNLQGILDNVMGDLKNKLLFTWDQEHCTDSGFMCLEKKDKPLYLKELSHIWEKKYPNLPWSDGEYSASNTLLVTYPEKALLNPPNTAIFPPSYDPESKKDDLLGPNGELRVFLEGLVEAEDVQTYVEEHPIGDPEITPSHPDWDHYCKIICCINKKRFGNPSPKLI